ncbi:hypothetical protein P43SY_003524 [Pythium insidiosum]|uniref:Uncharacterized protein n=1 Tax=Pythium insidiosum TaxID=114742 RepID=A0AAD5M3T5_PYTIN|nr:hypothetical protein P43SY_003524 [Pythium insidiosum]
MAAAKLANAVSGLNLAALAMGPDGLQLPSSSAAAAPAVYGTLPSMNPPLFFEIVEHQVYRSNKCDSSSFPFLATLQLNTVVYLSYDDLSRELLDFFKEREINVIHLGLKYRTSTPWKGISESMAKEAIEYILDQRRHPIMVMCNVKTRFENEQFIELFDVDLVTLPQQLPEWFLLNQTMMVRPGAWANRISGSTILIDNALQEEERIALSNGECFPGLKRRSYFHVQGPLTSPGVKFSEKKSIIGDDDDD